MAVPGPPMGPIRLRGKTAREAGEILHVGPDPFQAQSFGQRFARIVQAPQQVKGQHGQGRNGDPAVRPGESAPQGAAADADQDRSRQKPDRRQEGGEDEEQGQAALGHAEHPAQDDRDQGKEAPAVEDLDRARNGRENPRQQKRQGEDEQPADELHRGRYSAIAFGTSFSIARMRDSGLGCVLRNSGGRPPLEDASMRRQKPGASRGSYPARAM